MSILPCCLESYFKGVQHQVTEKTPSWEPGSPSYKCSAELHYYLQSDLGQVTCLRGLYSIFIRRSRRSLPVWHVTPLNSVVLLDALLEHLLKLPGLKNNLFEVASSWPSNTFASISCTGPTQETMPIGGLHSRVFLSAVLLLIQSTKMSFLGPML